MILYPEDINGFMHIIESSPLTGHISAEMSTCTKAISWEAYLFTYLLQMIPSFEDPNEVSFHFSKCSLKARDIYFWIDIPPVHWNLCLGDGGGILWQCYVAWIFNISWHWFVSLDFISKKQILGKIYSDNDMILDEEKKFDIWDHTQHW